MRLFTAFSGDLFFTRPFRVLSILLFAMIWSHCSQLLSLRNAIFHVLSSLCGEHLRQKMLTFSPIFLAFLRFSIGISIFRNICFWLFSKFRRLWHLFQISQLFEDTAYERGYAVSTTAAVWSICHAIRREQIITQEQWHRSENNSYSTTEDTNGKLSV